MTHGITELLRAEPPQPLPSATLAYIRENISKMDVFQRRGLVVLPGGNMQESYACVEGLLSKLFAIAEAAKNEALGWTESLCNHAECEQRDAAWADLDKALAALEAE